MSPMTAMMSTINPPPPIPCSARKPISCDMLCDRPARAEAMTKIATADCSMSLRPYWSESLPHSGVLAVEVSR